MPGTLTIELKGFDELQKKLGDLKARRYARGVLQAAGLDIQNWVSPYPPAPSYSGRSWYERGYGPRWRTKDGSIHGRRTSQALGRRWATRVDPDGLTVHIGNQATYAPKVHDEAEQPGFHKARGWRTIQAAAKQFGPLVIEKIRKAIEDVWRS